MVNDLGLINNNDGMLTFNEQELVKISDQDCLSFIGGENYSNYIITQLRSNTCEGVSSIAKDGKYVMPFLCNHHKVLEDTASIDINCSIKLYKDGYIIASEFDSHDFDGGETYRSWRVNTIHDDLRDLCGLDSYGLSSGDVSKTIHNPEEKIVVMDFNERVFYEVTADGRVPMMQQQEIIR
jgi:hypothetical protein